MATVDARMVAGAITATANGIVAASRVRLCISR
jgi:hypothetical protein